MNEWHRITGVFARPRPVFSDLRERPRWIVPLVVIVVFLLLQLVTIVFLRIGFGEQVQMLQEQGLSPEQMAQAEKVLQGPLPLIGGTVSILLVTPASFLIVALILNTFVLLLGGEGSFRRSFAVVTYSGLVRIPAIVLKTVFAVIKGSPAVFTSLILLFPGLPQKGFWFNLLSRIDFFTIWELTLIAFGLGITSRITGKKTYFLVFGLWLVYLILTALVGGILSLRPK